ncbi:PEP-CTERM sorting domain-containing protein [Nostoc sp.]|uniref:PEP-CTERM sorting domain-containing protein n=1 Tax=Nostoc sp. TaxID=1180 RepID=UPI002FFAF4DC
MFLLTYLVGKTPTMKHHFFGEMYFMAISTVMKNLSMATVGAIFIALSTLGVSKAEAAVTVLNFEGVGNFNPVGNFHDTAPQDFDITFSPNALGIVDNDAGGSGDFGGEPSPDTDLLFFLDPSTATLNAQNGFDTGLSFFYSAILSPAFVNIYDGLNATGNLLATINLPLTPFNAAPDPTGQFSPFVPIGVSFSGIAKSVDFRATVGKIYFDDITLGSAIPGGSQSVPESGSILGVLAVGAFSATTLLKRKQQQKAVAKG